MHVTNPALRSLDGIVTKWALMIWALGRDISNEEAGGGDGS